MTVSVKYAGNTFNFPDGTSQEKMEEVLNSYTEQTASAAINGKGDGDASLRTETTAGPAESYFQEGESLQAMSTLDAEQQRFVDAIAKVETGGLENRFIRTNERPTGNNSGSSAYGTYQITHGLLRGYVEQNLAEFTEQETAAAQELMRRQEIGLAIGGRDRVNYQKGGAKHSLAVLWSKQYGYEDTEAFLNDFDYGGSYGLADDENFQVLYESFGRKMLKQHLKDAKGNAEQAAALWHGGLKGAGKKTERYVRKFRNAYGTGEEG